MIRGKLTEIFTYSIKEVAKDRVILSLQIAEFHKQPFSLLHGGMNDILIETACSI